jgi:hypothetical protein
MLFADGCDNNVVHCSITLHRSTFGRHRCWVRLLLTGAIPDNNNKVQVNVHCSITLHHVVTFDRCQFSRLRVITR